MSKRLIPFSWMPGSWGLSGKVYEEAKAYYEFEGEDLDRRLLILQLVDDPKLLSKKLLGVDLKYSRITPYAHDTQILVIDGLDNELEKAKLDLKYDIIDEYTFDKLVATTSLIGIEQSLALLDVEAKHGKISKVEFEKQQANIDEKPWIGILDQGLNIEEGINSVFFEFDWNHHWIDFLRINGYSGNSEEDIVERWYQDVCRAVIAENPNDVLEFPVAGKTPQRKTNSIRRDDNNTFYT